MHAQHEVGVVSGKDLAVHILAKHFVPHIAEGGSVVLFSGVAAFKPVVGYLGVAITNGRSTSSNELKSGVL
jgi:hypothetical protein